MKKELSLSDALNAEPLYHGTKADLKSGDLIEPGFNSNYGKQKKANFVYLTGTLDAAIWGAELASGSGLGRIYLVEPTGGIEDDPNPTDKKFPGNPTKSYRSQQPLRVVGEVLDYFTRLLFTETTIKSPTPECVRVEGQRFPDCQRRSL